MVVGKHRLPALKFDTQVFLVPDCLATRIDQSSEYSQSITWRNHDSEGLAESVIHRLIVLDNKHTHSVTLNTLLLLSLDLLFHDNINRLTTHLYLR